MRRVMITLLLAGAGLIAVAPPAAADPPVGAGYTPVFSDEFNDSTVDTSKWNYRTDSKAYSTQRPENVSESGGSLNIALKRENFGGKEFTGGGVVSKQTLRYGFYETRARINNGSGWHTAFWLQAGNGSTTFPAEQRTEVDIFEIDSIHPTRLRHNIITWNGSGSQAAPYHSSGIYDIGFDLRQWHTYAVDWQETSAKFYVDGVLKYTAPYPPSQWTHDYTSIWLTSIGYGTRPDEAFLPSSVQFDYVRYWQKDYYVDNDGPAAYGYSETGTWASSTLHGWTYRSPTRYGLCNTAGQTATWRPNLKVAGTYQVYYYNVVHSNSDPATRLQTVHSGGTATTTVNGRTGSSGWVSLGTYTFGSGTAGNVKLTSSGTGCARADAVKFVRVP